MRRNIAITAAGSLLLAALALPAIGQEGSPGQAKHEENVSTAFEVPIAEVAALREAGAGWGVIRHAYALSEDEGITVEEALAMIQTDTLELEGPPPWAHGGHLNGLPPGQAKQATALETLTGLSSDDLFALHATGVGWGLMRNGWALAEADGVSLEEAIDSIRSGNRNGQGPPPWARNNK